jgi:hypothetical protein
MPLLDEVECVSEIIENFEDAEPMDVADLPDDWTLIDEHIASPAAFFVQVELSDANNGVLIYGDDVFLGTKDGDSWLFSWESYRDGLSSETHRDGYFYSEEGLNSMVESFSLVRDGKNVSGSYSITTRAEVEYTETDEWDTIATGIGGAQMPSYDYLEGNGAVNSSSATDCTDAECVIELNAECVTSAQFVGMWVGFSADSYYLGLSDVDQEAGDHIF